jgi:hypothetical protein
MAPLRDSFVDLWYRYWFFGWLFIDATCGSQLQRESALRHNRRQARWLPVYMRRWSALGGVLFLVGLRLEFAQHTLASVMAFVPACLTVSVVVVAGAGWVGLRAEASRSGSRAPRR